MARRELSAAEENALIAEAEAARDDPDAPIGRPVRIRRGAQPTSVVSVRLPVERARRLRELAAARGDSLSELIQDAVEALLAQQPPSYSYGLSAGSVSFRAPALAEEPETYNPPTSIEREEPEGPETTL